MGGATCMLYTSPLITRGCRCLPELTSRQGRDRRGFQVRRPACRSPRRPTQVMNPERRRQRNHTEEKLYILVYELKGGKRSSMGQRRNRADTILNVAFQNFRNQDKKAWPRSSLL